MTGTTFRDTLMGAGSYCTQECACGRIHFTNQMMFYNDDIELLNHLLEKQKTNPDKYVLHDKECITFVDVPFGQAIDGCVCTTLAEQEKWVWANRRELLQYLLHRQEMENHLKDLKDEYVHPAYRSGEEKFREGIKVINSG